MDFVCQPSSLTGTVAIPGSKSHTIRGVVIATLADGESVLDAPMDSADTLSAVRGAHALGAEVDLRPGRWTIRATDYVTRVPGSGTVTVEP